jgi:hypothetical protein
MNRLQVIYSERYTTHLDHAVHRAFARDQDDSRELSVVTLLMKVFSSSLPLHSSTCKLGGSFFGLVLVGSGGVLSLSVDPVNILFRLGCNRGLSASRSCSQPSMFEGMFEGAEDRRLDMVLLLLI